MTLNYFITYFSILFIATITPGPSMLLALNHGVNHGLARTLYSGLGNLIGNLIMALVSIAGLGVILVTSGFLFSLIKWAGIMYLVYIGIRMIAEPDREVKTHDTDPVFKTKSRSRLIVDGFVIAIGNPKGILFFTALFPQFIDTKHTTPGVFMILFLTLGLVAFGCYMLYAIFGVRLNRLFQIRRFRRGFNRITGSVFIGTGLAIAFSKK
jgi:homoserine/homoserine lactone efflux protein